MYSANLLLGKRVLLSALFLLCFIGLSGATSAFVGTTPAGNVAETQTSEPPKNSGGGNWSAFFESSRPLAQDWRQYAARDEVKPALQTPGRIVLERTPLRHDPTPLLLLTLQADNIQVREAWQVTNAMRAFDIDNGKLYLTAYPNEAATFVATVYLIDEFQMLNAAYQNLTASAVITVEVMLGDLSAEQPPRLEVVEGVAEEVYVFDAHGGTRPHTYTLLHNPDANAFVFSNGTLSVNVSATIGEYRFTVAVADAGNMSVTVVATVSVGAAATIQVAGGAVFVVQGQEQEVGDGEAISFNPRSQSGVMVSVKAAATVALTAPDDAWQITLYGGGEAFFAGVADAGSDEVVVGVSLMGDSDFVRNTDEKVALDYVFSDEVIVPVVPQGTRIFCRSYGRLWYLVIDEGVADLPRWAPENVNFLAFRGARWTLNGSLFKKEEPFTLDDFMATVSYRYAGEVGEVQANDGVAPSFSLVGDTEVFALTMWSGLRYDQWLPGLLAIIEGQEGPLALSVTVAVTDHLGDMLGDYGYANRMATMTAVVQVESAVPLVVSASEAQPGIAGDKSVLLALTADGGAPPYTYSIVTGNDSGYFDLTVSGDGGELSVLEDAVAGIYTLSIVIRDSGASSAVVAVTVTLQEARDNQIFVLGGWGDIFFNDVWSSTDGNAWLEVIENNDMYWPARDKFQAVAHRGRMYVLGGFTEGNVLSNDVWSSADGKIWVRDNDGGWGARLHHQAVSHHGTLYVMGGRENEESRTNDVWSSVDGETWTRMNDAAWERRYRYQSLSHNGRLYVLGGWTGYRNNDVWSSADGNKWLLETDHAEWAGRHRHQAVSHNGRIYVMGGTTDTGSKNDVWSSADGKVWRQETDDAGWSTRGGLQAISYNGWLWVMGGDHQENDVWSSADGKSWTEQNRADWHGREYHQALVFPPELALYGVGERLSLTVGISAELHTFITEYGTGDYSYELSPAVAGFEVDGGVLSADANAIAGEYTLTVWAEDKNNGARAQTVLRVYVLSPYLTQDVVTITVSAGNAELHTFALIGGVGAKTYKIAAGGEGYFGINASSGVLSMMAAVAGAYVLSIEASDSAPTPNKVTAVAKVYVDTVFFFAAPRLTTFAGKVISVHTFQTDGGIGEKTYTIAEGNGRGYFSLNENSGVLSLANAAKGVYALSIEAVDSEANKAGVMATVHVENGIFVFGGWIGEVSNDVWSSADGKTWFLEAAEADWDARCCHQAVAYNNKMYVMAGWENDNYRDDIWSSADGKSWDLEDTPEWSGRSSHSAVLHNGKLYVLGGNDGSRKNDVWSSADGETWVQETAHAGWSERDRHQVVSFNGRLYVLGGRVDNSDRVNDVWSSADGKTWVQENDAGWLPRDGHQAVVHHGKIYVLGGVVGRVANDVWSSVDGETWVQENDAGWLPRTRHHALSRNGRLYVLGGVTSGDVFLSDVWFSVDGKTWAQETADADWVGRCCYQALVFPPELVLFGAGERVELATGERANIHTLQAANGAGEYTYSLSPLVGGFAVVGSVLMAQGSASPGEYTLNVQANDRDGNRAQTAVRVHVGMFTLAGAPPLATFAGRKINLHTFDAVLAMGAAAYTIIDGNQEYFSVDVNSGILSVDGARVGVYTVRVEVSAGTHQATAAATIKVDKNWLFVFGGETLNNAFKDIWASADGKNWTQQNNADWPARSGFPAVVLDGAVYVMGGWWSNESDVWSSGDFNHWSLQTESGWPGLDYRQAVVLNSTIYAMGGRDQNEAPANDVWSSVDGKTWLRRNNAAWAPRWSHQAVLHNDKIYVVGGYDGRISYSDVWSSSDGETWLLETNSAPVGEGNIAVSHNGKLYVFDSWNRKVWSSADGAVWLLETGDAEWPRRDYGFRVASYNGKMYLSGGSDFGGSYADDVWSSVNGKTWSLETNSPGWAGRADHQMLVFPPELILHSVGDLETEAGTEKDLYTFTAQYGAGDYTYSLLTDDFLAWFQVDGGVLHVSNAPPGEYALNVQVEDGDGNRVQTVVKVYVGMFSLADAPPLATFARRATDLHTFQLRLGAGAATYTIIAGNEQYFSIDANSGTFFAQGAEAGVYTLTLEASDSASPPNKATAMATVNVAKDGIFILGGRAGSSDTDNTATNDIWSSVDGKNWSRENNPYWPARGNYQAVVHHGRIYVLGGGGNDVWSLGDDNIWSLETGNADWSVRHDHQALSHNGSLYVLGGTNDGDYKNDVWSSADGKTWLLETDSAAWQPRAHHQAVSYNDKIYVSGGWDGSSNHNDVWSSVDGKTWTLETNNASWGARASHQVVVFNDKLYLSGGWGRKDVWSSTDAKNWSLETANAAWSVRNAHQVVIYSGKMYLLGGRDDSGGLPAIFKNDVWSSSNGITWSQETLNADWSTRAFFQAVVFPPE